MKRYKQTEIDELAEILKKKWSNQCSNRHCIWRMCTHEFQTST